MRDIFTAELTALGEDLVAMGRLVETAITSAGEALLTGDLTLAESVIADDHTIDAMERDLDERCVMLIAQQQPVARDLRVIIAGLRMSASLERMGDLARHVAQVARLRYPGAAIPAELVPTFTAMHLAAIEVARRVTTVMETEDLSLAAEIDGVDDSLDRLLAAVFAATTADPCPRFGDHGVSVAERVVYLVTGEVEEHHRAH